MPKMSTMGSIHVRKKLSSGEFCVGISLENFISGSASSRRFTRSMSGKMPVL